MIYINGRNSCNGKPDIVGIILSTIGVVAFIGLLVLVIVGAFGCGSGGNNSPGLNKTQFGVHLLPLAITEQGALFPTADDYQRISVVGEYVVSNFPVVWWHDFKPQLKSLIDNCHVRNLKLIIRLEDWFVHTNVPGAHAADAEWFANTFAPYVRDVVQYGLGRVWAYQVGNEVWEQARFMLGPTGAEITAAEYVLWLKTTQEVIHEIDPFVHVLNAGVTTITEDRYFEKAKRLLAAGVEQYTDLFNVHLYLEEIEQREINAVNALSKLSRLDWIVTEINHSNPFASNEQKLEAIQFMWDLLWHHGKGTVAILGFCWQYDANLAGWAIKDGLEKRLPWVVMGGVP